MECTTPASLNCHLHQLSFLDCGCKKLVALRLVPKLLPDCKFLQRPNLLLWETQHCLVSLQKYVFQIHLVPSQNYVLKLVKSDFLYSSGNCVFEKLIFWKVKLVPLRSSKAILISMLKLYGHVCQTEKGGRNFHFSLQWPSTSPLHWM